jgi:hypothetical protein
MTGAARETLDYHVARVLLLVNSFSSGSRGKLDGLTKLAKLDFLLRYPTFLDKLLSKRGVAWPNGLAPSSLERRAVESHMVRYKYGPWDDRYYPIIGRLVGTELVRAVPGKGKIALRATRRGQEVANALAHEEGWNQIAGRSELLHEFFNLNGSQLKDLIYTELPEAVDHPWWTRIPPPEFQDE